MAYFNPIYYFIKSFIRLFTRKFFWVLLILFFIFLGFILFNNNVFAYSSDNMEGKYYSTMPTSVLNGIKELSYYNNYYSAYGQYTDGYVPDTNYRFRVIFLSHDSVFSLTELTADGVNTLTLSSGTAYLYYYNSSGVLGYTETVSPTGGTTFNFVSTTSHRNYYIQNFNFNYKSNFNYNSSNIGILPVYVVKPYFITTDEELQTFDFDYLQINGGTTKYQSYYEPLEQTYTAEFKLTYYYKGVATNIDILPEYIAVNTQENTWQINIPYNVLTNKVIVRNGEKFSYRFSYKNGYESGYEMTTGELSYDLTTEQEEQINAESDKQLQGQILETQQQTNDKLDNLDSTINDSSIDNITNDTLPTDNTNDITSDGVNGIFTSIYNAFCTGNAQDIVFPIPFTNKNITLQANYVYNMLSSNGAGWVVTIIQAFWWYLISRFIIKDVMDKINKIKSGNIEDIETTNIRGDML